MKDKQELRSQIVGYLEQHTSDAYNGCAENDPFVVSDKIMKLCESHIKERCKDKIMGAVENLGIPFKSSAAKIDGFMICKRKVLDKLEQVFKGE